MPHPIIAVFSFLDSPYQVWRESGLFFQLLANTSGVSNYPDSPQFGHTFGHTNRAVQVPHVKRDGAQLGHLAGAVPAEAAGGVVSPAWFPLPLLE